MDWKLNEHDLIAEWNEKDRRTSDRSSGQCVLLFAKGIECQYWYLSTNNLSFSQ